MQAKAYVWPTRSSPGKDRAWLPVVLFLKAGARNRLKRYSTRPFLVAHFGPYFTTRRRKAFSGRFPMIAKSRISACWLKYRRNSRISLLLDGPEATLWLTRQKIALRRNA